MKKILSLLLAVMMIVSLCPISALADEVNPIELQQVEAQEEQQEEPLPEPVEEQPTEEQPQQSELNPLDLTGEAAPLAEGSGEGWDGATATEPKQVNEVYQIGTAEELAWFAAKVNDGTAAAAKAVLTADIDLNSKEWTPIGNDDNPYEGTFDGADHRVNNLSITKGGVYAALFGYASGGAIKNITVSGKIAIDDYTDYSSDVGCIYAAGVVGNGCLYQQGQYLC